MFGIFVDTCIYWSIKCDLRTIFFICPAIWAI